LTHRRRGDASELNTFFGADVRFGATVDELVFSPSIREIAVVSADPFLHDLLVKYCEEALASRAVRRSPFGLSVENAIVTLLPHGHARAGDVAQQLGVSQRTLARKLASEGLTFAGVLQSLRADLAKRHLMDETLPISKIAWLLGYQDVSAFTHAFKRWTGSTPRAARGGSG
jgi:AraC-like DNA-binding protein